MGQTQPLFVFYLRPFHNAKTTIAQCEYVTTNEKSFDGVLGTQTRGGRMEGIDVSWMLKERKKSIE